MYLFNVLRGHMGSNQAHLHTQVHASLEERQLPAELVQTIGQAQQMLPFLETQPKQQPSTLDDELTFPINEG